MEIKSLFEQAVGEGLFTDFDVCVIGTTNYSFRGGKHVREGATLFDVASLTKACTHLLFLKMFSEGKLSPNDSFKRFISVPQENKDDRLLWHFLCYVVQSYNFDYESLRDGTTMPFRETLTSKGFGHWGKRFKYDNIASAYLALLLEKIFGTNIEKILQEELLNHSGERNNFLFHPIHRGLVGMDLVVPTRKDIALRGLVHDPLSFHHQETDLSVAGLFSDARTLADAFHRGINQVIASGFYKEVSNNQLLKLGVNDSSYGLGFDIPFQSSLSGLSVEGPLVFAGWTGCRVFFAEKPRVTICFLTNRVFCEETEESRRRFSQFSWRVIRTVLQNTV